MEHTGERVEFENDRVRVIRVRTGAHSQTDQSSRYDRLIIYLQDGHILRTENGKQEEIHHKAGDVVWRDRSQHRIHNMKDTDHEVLIIELKQRV